MLSVGRRRAREVRPCQHSGLVLRTVTILPSSGIGIASIERPSAASNMADIKCTKIIHRLLEAGDDPFYISCTLPSNASGLLRCCIKHAMEGIGRATEIHPILETQAVGDIGDWCRISYNISVLLPSTAKHATKVISIL